MTYEELQNKIKELEEKKEFNTHINPIDYSNVIKVDENFPYLKKPLLKRIGYFFVRLFIVKPFARKKNKHEFKTKVFGRENLNNIKNAVVTSNHYDIFDCLANFKALEGHKVRTITAPFNNFKGRLGTSMRAMGILPMSDDFKGKHKFYEAIKTILKSNQYILIYPEESMWWHYKKPRPYNEGAFRLAISNNVPVIPMFSILKDTNKFDENNYPIHNIEIHIGKPIYPLVDADEKRNIEFMLQKNKEFCETLYKNNY